MVTMLNKIVAYKICHDRNDLGFLNFNLVSEKNSIENRKKFFFEKSQTFSRFLEFDPLRGGNRRWTLTSMLQLTKFVMTEMALDFSISFQFLRYERYKSTLFFHFFSDGNGHFCILPRFRGVSPRNRDLNLPYYSCFFESYGL